MGPEGITLSPRGIQASVHHSPVSRLRVQQLRDRRQDAQPHPLTVQVAFLKHGVGAQGGLHRCFGAVLVHQELGCAVDVEVVYRASRVSTDNEVTPFAPLFPALGPLARSHTFPEPE